MSASTSTDGLGFDQFVDADQGETMSGEAPSPKGFGRDFARAAVNQRTPQQMQPVGGGMQARDFVTGTTRPWYEQDAPTTLATTTGQNLTSTGNAFDTDFWEAAARQDKEQTTLTGRWSRPDATGVVTYDNASEGVEFGDVFVQGQKVGNAYKGYAGLTNADADEVMARLVLPREVWAKAYESEAGKPLTFAGNLSDEIQTARQNRTAQFAKGLSAAQFEGEVAKTASGYEDDTTAQALNVGAGIAGGTVTGLGLAAAVTAATGGAGAVAAPFIVGGFALAGGIGSYLNRDEAFRSYAQAMEMWESATDDGHQALGYADAAAGVIGSAADKLNVTRNLLHGGYDAANGEIGDQTSEYYDTELPLWMQGVDTAALLVDGIGSFGSAGARRVYTSLMGANAGAQQASVAIGANEGNVAFNPYSGAYEDIGASGMLQRQASVGIDVAQTTAAGMLGRVMNRGRAVTDQSISRGGWVVQTVDGAQQATRVGFSALIPSEAVMGISARAMARRTLLNEGRETTSANLARETARHLENLTTGRRSIAVMAVNGFGEGAEEFVQAALDATAFGETPTLAHLIEATRQGFAMGVGMGAAISAGSQRRTEGYFQAANTIQMLRGAEPYTPEQWSRFTDSERVAAGTASTEQEKQLMELTAGQLAGVGGRTAAANIPELRRATDVALQIAEQRARNSQEVVEPSRLSLRSNYDWAPQDYVVSLTAAMRDVEARLALMQAAASGEVIRDKSGRPLTMDDAERAQAGRVAEADAALLERMRQIAAQVEQAAASGDEAAAAGAVEALNADLRAWWHADESSDQLGYGKRRAASVWGARFPLNSAGSFQLLRLQVSPELTLAGDNASVLVPDEIQPAIGGDFDGDRFINMLRELLPDTAYQMLRQGTGLLTSTGVMYSTQPYMEAYASLLFAARQLPGTQRAQLADQTLTRVYRKVSALLRASSLAPRDRRTLVGQLVTRLRNGDARALEKMLNRLAAEHAPAMRALADQLDDSPWLTLARVVEDDLRRFQTEWALHTDELNTTGRVELPTVNRSMPARHASTTRATSDLLQAATITGRAEFFRLTQVLKYNARREATDTTPEETADALADLYRTFTARNDGLVRPGENALFDGTLAQSRTIGWLRDIASEARQYLGTATTGEAMVLLAGADVDDVDVRVRAPRSAGTVKLVQALLSNVVDHLRSEYAEVLGRDAALVSRINSLDSLTRPNFEDGDHTHAQGGDAFVEVLGAFPIYELLGEQGAAINTWTVRGLRNWLIGLRADVREEWIDALQAHPSYANDAEGNTSAYRVLIDNVTESARMQLSENRQTGVPTGALTRASTTASRNFADLHDRLRNIGNMRGYDMSTPAAVRAVLATDVRLAEAVMNLITVRGVVAGTVLRDTNGELEQVEFLQWVYDVFAEPKTKRAEMLLLRQTLLFAKLGAQVVDENGAPVEEFDASRVNDRILRLWLDLDYRAADATSKYRLRDTDTRDEFLRLLGQSQSVDEFIGALNLDHRFRDEYTPPFIAWARDRSVVEASRFGSGISDVQEGTEMRDALRDAALTAASVMNDEEAVQSYLDANQKLLADLRSARDGGVRGHNTELWERYVAWFNLSKDLPLLTSVSVWLQQAKWINTIVGNMGVKGVSPDNVAPLGKAQAAQLSSFDSAPGRLLRSMTAGDLGGLLSNPSQLAASDRQFVLNDGTVVDWTAVTPEQSLDLLSDPNTAGFAARMLGMTALDFNEELGQNLLVSIVGQGVAGFTADPAASLFGTDTESKFRRLMVLEGMATPAGTTPIIPMILAEQMNIREAALDHPLASDGVEREQMAVQILIDLADALDAVTRTAGVFSRTPGELPKLTLTTDEVTGERIPRLNQILLNAARAGRVSKGVDNLVASLLPLDPTLRDLTHEAVRAWHAKFLRDAVASGDPMRLKAAQKIARDLASVDEMTTPLDQLLDTYGDFTDPNTQALLVTAVRGSGDMVLAASWARDELLAVADTTRPQVPVTLSDGTEIGLPNLNKSQWETVARAVIAYSMHVAYGVAVQVDQQISVFPSLSNRDALLADRAAWDPTFVEPAIDLFAPGLLRNPAAAPHPLLEPQMRLVRAMGPTLPAIEDPAVAERAVLKLFMPKDEHGGVTGQWHALLPGLIQAAKGAVAAAAAESGIQMAGLTPEQLRFFAATTRQDWTRRPPDAELSTTALPVSQLVTAVGKRKTLTSQIDVTVAGFDGVQQRALAQLEGRVARRVEIVLPDGTRTNLMADPRYSTGLLLPSMTGVPAGEAGVLNLDTLRQAVSTWLLDAKVPRATWSTVQLELGFFHPDTKAVSVIRDAAAQYEHSPWFDGVGGKTDAAFAQQSLIASMMFSLDGLVPAAYERALASIKKLSNALQQVTAMPESERRARAERGLTDMAGMLDSLTTFAMQQPIDGKPLPLTDYNALRKVFSLLYVVRFVDETGSPRVLSSEEVIARQAAGQTFELGQHAEVIGLPLQHVLALMGEFDNPRMTVTPSGDQTFSPDVSRAAQYQRFPAGAWTEQMFGGFLAVERDAEGRAVGWASADLLTLPELQNQGLPRVRVRSRNGQIPRSPRDYFGPFRKHEQAVLAQRVARGGQYWAQQRNDAEERVRVVEANVATQVLQAIELAANGRYVDAARLASVKGPKAKRTNDYSTGWWYVHQGARQGDTFQGIITTSADIEANTAMGDTVYIAASTFLPVHGRIDPNEAFGAARAVLIELAKTGATINLPTDPAAPDLRRQMVTWLREHNYAEEEAGGGSFVPQPVAARSQVQAASESTLNGATHRTSSNRVLADLSPHNPANENSASPVNGGTDMLQQYHLRETVQTGRFPDYGPVLSAEGEQRTRFIQTLLDLVTRPDAREYLLVQSQVEPTDTAAVAELSRALDALRDRLRQAQGDPRRRLMPDEGDDFGTGDLVPLGKYDARGELVGIHLYRHGHEPVAEASIVGGALPEGNAALGVPVRLTIDKAKVDAGHTTHRGTIVEASWLGLEGMVLDMTTDLSLYGAKVFELGTGMKWTLTPLARDVIVPTHAILAGRPVLLAADQASPFAKNATAEWLSSVPKIVEAVGFDVMPYLVKLLRDVDYDARNPQTYEEAENQVRDMLVKFAARYSGSIPAAALVKRSTPEFRDLLLAQLRAGLEEVAGREIPALDAPAQQEMAVGLTYLEAVLSSIVAGGQLSEILSAPGYVGAPSGSPSHTMHPVFTTLIQALPQNHPARLAFVQQINSRLPFEAGVGYELQPNLTWIRHVTDSRGRHHGIPTMLAFPEIRVTDTNSELTEQAQGRKQRGSFSSTTASMMYATWGAVPALTRQLRAGAEVLAPNRYLHTGETGARRAFFNFDVASSPFAPRMEDDLRMTREEWSHITNRALPRRRALSEGLVTDGWFKDMDRGRRREEEQRYRTAFNDTLAALRLTQNDAALLVEMMRGVLARPGSGEQGVEYMTLREAHAALTLIQRNARNGDLPTYGGAVNLPSRAALARLHENGYVLRRGDGTRRPVENWDDWVDVMLSTVFGDNTALRGYPAVSNIVDGLLYEYRKDVRGLPATVQNRLAGILGMLRTNSGLLITSPALRDGFDSPSVQNGRLVGDVREFESSSAEFEQLPQDARTIVEQRMTAWESKQGISRRRQSPRAEAIAGAHLRNDAVHTNVLLRFVTLTTALKGLLNPGLWAGAFIELANKGGQERVVSWLAGETRGAAALGGQGFTPEQRAQWREVMAQLADSPAFYQRVYEHTNYRIDSAEAITSMEERLQRATNRVAAALNDPTWGTRSKVLASTFMEAAWDSINKLPLERTVTVEQFLNTLRQPDGVDALNQISRDAVAHGYSRIEYRRNLQDNLAELTRRSLVDGFINNGGRVANTLGVLFLRLPTLFFRFRSNTIINLLGLQAPHAVATALFSSRRKPGGLFSAVRGDTADQETMDTARIEDSYDLTRSVIRSGVSHTQLMMLAMVMSSLGLGGEDDEEKLLNKLRRYQKPIVAQDPLDLQNDFRNAEAWFSDLLPAGMGVPSWILRPFVSPAMGVARFAETGDFRQVLWGFMDALGNMPLLNVDNVMNSWMIANEFAAAAQAQTQDESDASTAEAGRLLFTAVGTLENLLLESAFLSMIYQGADEWDRDPYKVPLIDENGELVVNKLGLPRATTGLTEYVDPTTGEVKNAYLSRNDTDARLRALAENRPVFATLASIIMQDATFLRYNMVPKTREVDSTAISQEEATQIIVSILNHETGAEELTLDGAAGVIRGIHLGTVALDDPALNGIFIPKEMRFEIQKQVLGDLTSKYLDLGFSKSEALSKAKAEYYGQEFGAPEATGFADILWSDAIPQFQTQQYAQLNTTYVMGPNGRPIATGLQRSVFDAVGLNPGGALFFQPYFTGESGDLPTDQLLNSTDPGRAINLGQRGLVKIDESVITPTAEEIGESITEALDEIADQIDSLNDALGGFGGWGGWGGGRRGFGGGGGGGGYRADYGGQVVRLNTPRGFDVPYAFDPRNVTTSNPIIRRATVRRERFSSERGRLNQWQ
jgi:hypothetical protein